MLIGNTIFTSECFELPCKAVRYNAFTEKLLKKTITKFLVFVIFTAVAAMSPAACHTTVVGRGEPSSFDRSNSPYGDEGKIGASYPN